MAMKMAMKKSLFIFAAICAAAAVSCTPKELVIDTPEEKVEQNVKLIPITITASFESAKADMDGNVWTWQSGDKLAVFDGTAKREFSLDESAAGSAVAKFTGEVAEGFTSLTGVFPYSAAGDSYEAAVSIPAVQTVGSHQSADPLGLIAKAEGEKVSNTEYNFYFQSAVSLLKFTASEGATKVIIYTAAKDETIAGTSPSVTVNLGSAADGTKTFWAAVNPASYTGIHVFTLGSDGKYAHLATDKTIDLSTSGKGKNLGSVNTVAAGGTEVAVIEDGDDLASYLGSATEPTLDAFIFNDLDLTGKTVTSCATYDKTFDGLWHSIGNWTASNALFATNAGTIQNLVIDNTCKINWTAAIPDQTGVSFIVAKTHTGTVKDCEVAGSITVKTDNAGRIFCAGIVGESTTGTVKNCVFKGKIDVIFTSTSQSCSAVAGIVARAGKANSTNGKVIISGCKNYGSISFTFSGPADNLNRIAVGGILGQTVSVANADKDYGIIEKCENRGTVSFEAINGGNSKSNATLGGVAGIIEGSIRECNNYNSVTFKGSKDKATNNVSIGGVAGYVTLGATDCHNYGELVLDSAFAGGTAMSQSGGNTSCSSFGGVFGAAGEYAGGEVISGTKQNENLFAPPTSTVLVENCTNEVALTLNPKMIQSGGPKFLIGGVIGSSTATKYAANSNSIQIICRSAEGELAVDADKENHPSTVVSQHYVGGVVGYVGKKGVTIEDCHNTKAVSMVNISTTPGTLSYLGGLMGSYVSSATMTSCSNSGSVTYNAENPICLGGIAGAFNGTMTGTSNSGTVTNASSYTSTTAGKEAEVGGLVGYANATLTNCENSGNVSNAAAGGFSGGFVGGLGDANLKWTDCLVNCSVTGASTGASVLGRFRNNGTKTLTLGAEGAPFTIMGAAASLPEVGELNGNSVELANVVK